jgi:pyruvate formate lyase activating enzyme
MNNSRKKDTLHGLILRLQRMSTEDGPGIRTTVFFKGCNLRCSWCHNPESISAKPQIHWIAEHCIGCKTCLEVCPKEALSFSAADISIDRNRCDACGICARECPSAAMELLGEYWRAADLIKELIKDRAYYEKSGGGITLSGGDPTLQSPFASIVLKGLKRMGVQTALDTCGRCSDTTLRMLLPDTDLVLYDLKEVNSEKHQYFTGASNGRIFENLLSVRDYMLSDGHKVKLWIRTPIIPDATARPDNIKGIGEFIAGQMGTVVSRWELCSFNNLCKEKYRRLGMAWTFKDSRLLKASEMEQLADVARSSGVKPDIVHWSGSTR